MTPDDANTTDAPAPPTDEEIHCVDCGHSFVHTAAEKTFFAKMHYTNRPKRCVPCRRARKEGGSGGSPVSSTRGGDAASSTAGDEYYDIVCSACQKPDRVPFAPTPGREVFCHACHLARVKGKRGEGRGEGGEGGGGGKRAKRDGCPARR